MSKLISRRGELREEEYLLIIDKRIEEGREKVKEAHQLVAKLKSGVKGL